MTWIIHAATVPEALYPPNTVWDAQTTQNKMIEGMTPIQPGPEYVRGQRSRLDSALRHMHHADTERVMSFTNLSNPFNQKQKLADLLLTDF